MAGAAWHTSTPTWTGDISWHELAACRELGASDDYWFTLPWPQRSSKAQSVPEVRKALALCWDGCPVRLLCWAQAASDPAAEGVWGGEYWPTDWSVRRSMRSRGPIVQPRL